MFKVTVKKYITKMTTSKAVYVAGSYENRAGIRDSIKRLEGNGFQVTHDWTKSELDHPENMGLMRRFADEDVCGVERCEALVVYMDEEKYAYRGTWTEIGVALGLWKEIYVVMPNRDRNDNWKNVFLHHELVQIFDCEGDMIRELKKNNELGGNIRFSGGLSMKNHFKILTHFSIKNRTLIQGLAFATVVKLVAMSMAMGG